MVILLHITILNNQGAISMKFHRIMLTLIIAVPLLFAGCGTKSSSASIQTETTETESESSFIRARPDSILFKEYYGLKDVYGYEPFYSAEEWMDEEGKLLFPYDEYRYRMEGMSNILASLDVPEEVLQKAATEDVLKVVCEGWLTSGATLAYIFNFPSDYVNIASANIGVVNELLQRSDMAKAVLEDYCTRNYVPGSETSKPARDALNQVVFDEILLASNLAFSQMDENMKRQVIDEVMKKLGDAESGKYWTQRIESGFFAYIAEEQEAEGSLWYDYISKNCSKEVKQYLTTDYMRFW